MTKKEKFIELAPHHTRHKLISMIPANRKTIERYIKDTGIRPKPDINGNNTLDEWYELFNQTYNGSLLLDKSSMYKTKTGHIIGTCECPKCHTKWETHISHKIRNHTGCIHCDKGNHKNKYSKQQVTELMNRIYANQWLLTKYGHYSKKDSIIKCTLCGHEQLVNLDNFINTTTTRCTKCQTGSFGEYVIANTLIYNGIPFEREKRININNKRYRLDFLIDNKIGIEYSGLQHFKKGLYYNEKINEGVRLKHEWCIKNNYVFYEMHASYNINEILKSLSDILNTKLNKPTPEFFKNNNPDMISVLNYMKTHSARQTAKDLNIPMSKIKKYVALANYSSISDWQSENKKQ